MKNIESKNAKSWTMAILTVVILGARPFATNASAQNAGVFEVRVPFDFVVMGRTYEAGRYRIGRLDSANPDTLVLKSSTDKTLLIFLTQRLNSGESGQYSRLTFRRYGDTNFLDTVRASGETYESRVPAARSDRRQRDMAQASQIVNLNIRSNRSEK